MTTTTAKLKEAEKLIDEARNILFDLQGTPGTAEFAVGGEVADEVLRRTRIALTRAAVDVARAAEAARKLGGIPIARSALEALGSDFPGKVL